MNQRQRVTMIDQLPDLNDLDDLNANQHVSINTNRTTENNYDKYIRNSHKPLQQSGMYYGNNENTQQDTFVENNHFEQPVLQNENIKKYILPNDSPSCIDVANHIELCPICSRYYKQDNSLYIIAILVLSVLCILLAKKILK